VLLSTLRGADVSCRLGGDELVAFLVRVGHADLETTGQQIRLAVAASPVRGRRLDASAGVASGHLRGDVAAADECMCATKQSGPNPLTACEAHVSYGQPPEPTEGGT